jgi:glucose/arabinose dehydrogenase
MHRTNLQANTKVTFLPSNCPLKYFLKHVIFTRDGKLLVQCGEIHRDMEIYPITCNFQITCSMGETLVNAIMLNDINIGAC